MFGKETIMDARRAQDLLRHITQDKDYGLYMMTKLPLNEAVYVVNVILPECIKEAENRKNQNDTGFFSEVLKRLRPVVIDKIKTAERLWVAYSELTGYPYMVDEDLIVLYDYKGHEEIEKKLCAEGYEVSFGLLEREQFKSEIGHMYRNGYKNIRFVDGKSDAFVVEREELFSYDEFIGDDFLTNPALQQTMIQFFQEVRNVAGREGREQFLKIKEDNMFEALKNAEFIVPCIREENDEEINIQYPFIDVTARVEEKAEDERVIAIPAFTDGFEMNKCYEGHQQHMVYNYDEIVTLVEELGASGLMINCLGQSYFMRLKVMKKVVK